MNLLRKLLNRQHYDPGLLGLFTNLFYFARRELHKYIEKMSSQITGKVLDVGCGSKPYRDLFKAVTEYHGLEYSESASGITHKAQDFVYDGHKFPFDESSYDCVISSEVLEHVFNVDEFLSEINRCLKKDGKLLLTVPFVWDEHEQPGDFGRYTSFGIGYLLQKHGFEVIEFYKTANDISIIFQLINDYIYKAMMKKNHHRTFVVNCFCCFFNILGAILKYVLPKNDDLYLDNIVLARKIL